MRLKQREYALIAEKGSTPFLSYSRSSVILHICYGESFLVPAGAWLCSSLTARARRSLMRVRLPPAHFVRRSGKIIYRSVTFYWEGVRLSGKTAFCHVGSTPTRLLVTARFGWASQLRGTSHSACTLRFVSSVGRVS